MSDFNILIGVDLSNAESKIADMIEQASKTYKLKLEATLEGKESVIKDIEKIKKVLSNLGIDLNASDFNKDVKDMGNTFGKMSDSLKNDMEEITSEAEEYSENMKDALKTYNQLLQVREKTDKKGTKITEKKGNDFITTTKVFDEDDKSVPEIKEVVTDIKSLNKYVEKLTDKTEDWKHVTELMPDDVDELKNKMAQLSTLMQDDPIGFDRELQNVKLISKQLERLEINFASKFKALDKAKQMAMQSEKGMNTEEDKVVQNTKLNQLKELATKENIGSDSFGKRIDEWIQKQKELNEESKENISTQKSVDKLTGKIKSDIEEWRKNGHLTNEEIDNFENSLQKINVLSENFNENLSKSKADFISLSEKENSIIEKKKDKEKALGKIDKSRVEWTKKINDLEREGYTHTGQMIALNNRLEKLDGERLHRLEDVNNLLKEMNEQYVRAQKYQKNTKLGVKRKDTVDDLTDKVDKNLNKDLIGEETIENIKKDIKEIFNTTSVEGMEKSVKKITKLYKDLLEDQKKAENKMKSQESISITQMGHDDKTDKLDKNGFVPKNLINEFRNLSSSLDFSSSKEEIAKVNRELQILVELEQDIVKAGKEESKIRKLIEKAQSELTRGTDRYLDRLDEINHVARRQLSNNENIIDAEHSIALIMNKVIDAKKKGIQLSYDENREIQKQITSVSRLIQSHKDLEQQISKEERTTQSLNDKLESMSYKALKGFDRFPKEARKIKYEIKEIQKSIDDLQNLSGEEYDKTVKDIEKTMKETGRVLRDSRDKVQERQNSFFGRFEHAIKQVPVWISAMTIFYGTMNQVAQGFQSLLDIDQAMTDLKKVTEATGSEMEEFKQVANEIGYELGVITSDVIRATTEFQKLGYTLEESTTLGKNSIIYANVGDMSVQEATSNIVSAIKGFGVAQEDVVNESQKYVDIFNEVGNNYAITSAGIGEALKRSSAVLHQAGNSIEQSVALVTSANTTIQDPKKVGVALKTISMRLRGVNDEGKKVAKLIPEIQEAFTRSGISKDDIMIDEDTFKSTYDIMDSLAGKWEELTDVQKAQLTELIGGKHQGSVVASMIENWTDATNSYETALNSAGSAQREFHVYMDSFEYKIGQLKVALEDFWLTLSNDDAIKGFIDHLTGAVNAMTKFVETFGGGQIIGNLIGLFAVFGSKTLRDTIWNPETIKEMRKEIVDLGASAFTTANGFKNIGKFIGFMARRFIAVIAVASVLTKVVEGVYKWWNRDSIARKKRIKELNDEMKSYEGLKEKMEEVNMERYIKLDQKENSGIKLNTEEYEEYSSLQEKIKQNLPELVSHYDKHGKAVIRDAESIRKLIENKRKLYNENRKEKIKKDIEEADFTVLEEKIKHAQEKFQEIKFSKENEDAMNFAKTFIEENIKGFDGSKEELEKRINQFNNDFSEMFSESNPSKMLSLSMQSNTHELLNNGNDTSVIEQYINGQINTMLESTSKLSKEYDKAKKDIITHGDEFKRILNEQFLSFADDNSIDYTSNEFLFFEKFKEQIINDSHKLAKDGDVKEEILNNTKKMLENVLNEMEEVNIDFDKLMEPSTNPDAVAKDFDIVINKLIGSKNVGKDFIDVLKEMKKQHVETARNMAKNPVDPFSFIGDVMPVVNEFSNNIMGLDSAYRTLAEGQELSMSQIFNLLNNYPELNKHLETHNGKLRLSGEALKELAKIKEQEFRRDLKIKKEQAENAKKKANDVIKSIMSEARAEQLLNDVREKGLQATVDSMKSKAYAMFGQGNGEMATAMLGEAYKVEKQLKHIADVTNEINAINSLIDTDFSSNLGSIGGSGSDREKQKKELQDSYYIADKFNQLMAELNHKIAMQQKLQDRKYQHSSKYQKSLREEIKLTQQKRNAIEEEIESLEKQVKSKNIQQTGMISVEKEDNKTSRAKQAELQQEIDKARQELLKLKEDSEDTLNRLKKLSFSLIETNLELYNEKRQAVSDDIAYTEYSMELYDKSSNEYRRYANTKISYLKKLQTYHQQELAYLELEKETNKNLTDSQKHQLNELIRESRQSIYDANVAVIDLQQALSEINVNKIIEKFVKETDVYAEKIDKIREKLKYDIKDDEYAQQIKSLKDIMSLQKGQVEDAKKNIDKLKELKQTHKGNHELVEKINEEIEKWEKNLKKAQTEVKDVGEELNKVYEEVGDNFVDLYKEQLELMKRAEEEKYEDMMEKEDKAHSNRMKHMDEELNKIRKIYNERMKMIDRDEAERDFDNDLDELEDETKEIQKQINLLSMDDSYEAQSRRTELEEKLAEKSKEIAEVKHDRQIELRKNDLEDDLAKEEEKVENKKSKYQEDYDSFLENEEKKKELRDKYWEQMLNDERKFAKIRAEVLNGNFEGMLETVKGWSSDVANEMSTLGVNITNNFTDKVAEAIKSLKELKSMKVGSYEHSKSINSNNQDAPNTPTNEQRDKGSLGNQSNSNKTTKDTGGVSVTTEINRKSSNSSSKPSGGSSNSKEKTESKRYHKIAKGDTMAELAMKYYGKAYPNWKKIRDANPKVNPNNMQVGTKLLIPFKSGGYTGDWSGDNGRLALLHKKELVLNQDQTQHILQTAKVVDKLKNILPKLNISRPQQKDQLVTTNINNEYNVNVNVESMNGNRKSADVVAEQIVNKMKRTRGGRY